MAPLPYKDVTSFWWELFLISSLPHALDTVTSPSRCGWYSNLGIPNYERLASDGFWIGKINYFWSFQKIESSVWVEGFHDQQIGNDMTVILELNGRFDLHSYELRISINLSY